MGSVPAPADLRRLREGVRAAEEVLGAARFCQIAAEAETWHARPGGADRTRLAPYAVGYRLPT